MNKISVEEIFSNNRLPQKNPFELMNKIWCRLKPSVFLLIPWNINFLPKNWKFNISDHLQNVFWNGFALITPWFKIKLRNLHNGSYISTQQFPIATVVYSVKVLKNGFNSVYFYCALRESFRDVYICHMRMLHHGFLYDTSSTLPLIVG